MTESVMQSVGQVKPASYPSDRFTWRDALLMTTADDSTFACAACLKRPAVVENADTERVYCFECAVLHEIDVDNVYVGQGEWENWQNVVDQYLLKLRDLQDRVQRAEGVAKLNGHTIKAQQEKYSKESSDLHKMASELRDERNALARENARLKAETMPQKLRVALMAWCFDNAPDIVAPITGPSRIVAPNSDTLIDLWEEGEYVRLAVAIDSIITDIAAGRGTPTRLCPEHRESDSCEADFLLPFQIRDALQERRSQ